MIALSSFRPLVESAEYKANQIRAKKSWEAVFTSIIYFNEPDEEMNGAKVYFEGQTNEPPTIKALAERASRLDEYVAIVNADIVIDLKFQKAIDALVDSKAICAVSRRFEFDPAEHPYAVAKATDLGMDFFCAMPFVWGHVAKEVSESYHLGSPVWDCWTYGFFNKHYRDGFFDFSRWGLVFHPKHGDRNYKHEIDPKTVPWTEAELTQAKELPK